MTGPRLIATATALPEYRVTQQQVKEMCRVLFRGRPHLENRLSVFDHAGILERYFSFPLEYYFNGHTFAERNRDYVAQAKKLGAQVLREALGRAHCGAEEIDQIYFVTTTGLATPSIDALLASELGFRPDLQRYPLFGLGCAGGAAALARAAHALNRSEALYHSLCSGTGQALGGKALVLSIELCGQTFLKSDLSMENLVGAALFGDGAAAVVLGQKGLGPHIVAWGSELFEGTREVMGWEFLDEGFKLVLSTSVPEAIAGQVVPAVWRFLKRQGLTLGDIKHFLLHPGGSKVLSAYESSLGADLQWTRRSLERLGNLSSASVLFMLHDLLESGATRKGDLGLLVSVGPGFAMEAVLLQW